VLYCSTLCVLQYCAVLQHCVCIAILCCIAALCLYCNTVSVLQHCAILQHYAVLQHCAVLQNCVCVSNTIVSIAVLFLYLQHRCLYCNTVPVLQQCVNVSSTRRYSCDSLWRVAVDCISVSFTLNFCSCTSYPPPPPPFQWLWKILIFTWQTLPHYMRNLVYLCGMFLASCLLLWLYSGCVGRKRVL